MQTVTEYLANTTSSQQKEYDRIRKIVLTIVPEAEETISYGLPTFRYKGKYVLYFGAFKDHMSLFPGGQIIDELKERLTDYKLSKGTIKYTEKNLVPKDIIEELVKNRLAVISEK